MATVPARFLPFAILAGLALATGLLLGLGRRGADQATIAAGGTTIERTLGLEIVVLDEDAAIDTPWGDVAAKSVTRQQVDRYLPLLHAELRKYPPELIERMQLRRLVLCRELRLGKQPRAAVPLYAHHSMHLDVVAGDYSRNYQRIVLHHELMHVIDHRDDGKVYQDPEWTELNDPQFRYGTGGRNAQNDPKASLHLTGVPGFLTSYGTTGVEEDKAELFARMMVEPDYVARRVEDDPILRSKVVRMKELLVAFCPQFDDKAWPGAGPRVK